MPAEKRKLLMVDDLEDMRYFITEVAEAAGYEVFTAATSDQFKEAYILHNPDRIILDLHLQGADGIELIRYLAEKKSAAEIIIISGMDMRTMTAAKALGEQRGLKMCGVLHKPFQPETLRTALGCKSQETTDFNKDDIVTALAEEQIAVYFQPQIRLQKDGNWMIDSVEALARWHHPQFGLVMPDRFIPHTEKFGLMTALTDYTLRRSMRCLRQWEKSGTKLGIALNLSGSMLSDLSLPDHIENEMKKLHVPTDRLMLEVTETAIMGDISRATDILARFLIKGFELSMDDFGTGYSSLVQLYRLPFGELKIDRSFVMEMHSNKKAEAIVRGLISLAHNMGLITCAEGVEDKKTFEALTDLGCKKMQGYYFGKAVSAEDIIPVIQNFHNQQVRSRIKTG